MGPPKCGYTSSALLKCNNFNDFYQLTLIDYSTEFTLISTQLGFSWIYALISEKLHSFMVN